MTAGKYDFTIEQGAKFTRVFTWKDSAGTPINLTGYTAAMQIRKDIEATATLVSLTSGSGITLGGALGTITVEILATATAAYSFRSGVYDLELYPAGNAANAVRLLEGAVTVSREVTR